MARLTDKDKPETPFFKRREELGLSQVAVAGRAGMNPADVSKIENGALGRAVSAERLVRLASALELTMAETVDLLERSGNTVHDAAKALIAA